MGALADALLAAPFTPLPAEDGGTVLLLSGEDKGGEDEGEDDAGDTLEPVASDAAAAAAAFLLDRSDRIFTRLSRTLSTTDDWLAPMATPAASTMPKWQLPNAAPARPAAGPAVCSSRRGVSAA